MANERQLLVRIVGDSSSLERAFTRSSKSGEHFALTMRGVTRSTGGFARGFASGAGALSSFGGALALTSGSFFAGAGIVAGLKASVNAAGDFQRTLNVLQSVSGATAAQMKAVSREATRLGADLSLPATSATDAANAMTQLVKGGLSVAQALDAARGTLQLSAAAQTDVATAANITARTLQAFSLSGGKAGTVADALANAANAATGDITDFAIGLQQSATVAHQFGLSAEDTVAVLAELAKAGLVGSDAGTSLRVMLSRLLPTSVAARKEMTQLGISVQDSSGHFLEIRQIIDEYSRALSKLTPSERQHALQTIFGTDAQRAANIILGDGVKNYDNLRTAVGRQGAAAKLAAAQQKGFKGALDGFNSALQTTEVTLGTALLPALTRYLKQAGTWLSDTKNQKRLVDDLNKTLAVIGATFKTLKQIINAVDHVTGGFKQTLELLLALKVGSVLLGWSAALRGVATAEKGVAASAVVTRVTQYTGAVETAGAVSATSAAKVGALSTKLEALGKIAPIVITITLLRNFVDNFKDAQSQGRGIVGSALTAGSKAGKVFEAGFPGLKAVDDAIRAGLKATATQKLPSGPGKAFADSFQFGQDFVKGIKDRFVKGATKGLADPFTVKAVRKGITPSQLNTFFDNAISRQLGRVQDLGIGKQIAGLNQIAGQIQQRIARTKDVTRKLKLEDDLLNVFRQEKQVRQQLADDFLAALQFDLTKAQDTLGSGDDIRVLGRIQKALEARIKAEGKTADLQAQLHDVQQQIKTARQFRALGLGATGETIAPLQTKTLRSQLAKFSDVVQGTFLDTSKTQSVLSKIRRVLGGGLGALSKDVRATVKQMLGDLDQQLKDHKGGPETAFQKADTSKLLAGLGLDPATFRAVRARLSQVGAGGTVPRGSAGAPALAGVGSGTAPPFTANLILDGRVAATVVSKHQDRRARRNPGQRRGPHAGQ